MAGRLKQLFGLLLLKKKKKITVDSYIPVGGFKELLNSATQRPGIGIEFLLQHRKTNLADNAMNW